MRLGLALVIFAGIAPSAAACINDRELPSHEREFRSNYGEPTSPTPPPPLPNPYDFVGVPSHPILLGTGAALLTGAFLVTANGKRARI